MPCRMTDYMLANALQQSLLHALTQLLELLTGCSWLDQAEPQAHSLLTTPSVLSTTLSLQSGQPAPVTSWQTGQHGAQPLPLMSVTSGLPIAQPESLRSTRTASIPSNSSLKSWIKMSLLLDNTGEDLVLRPPVADFIRHFDNMLRDLPNTIAVVQRLVTHSELEVRGTAWQPGTTLITTVSGHQLGACQSRGGPLG